MKENQSILAKTNSSQARTLNEQITLLEHELSEMSNQLGAFEAMLRSALSREIIEEQELSVLYKTQKAEKKIKRLKQKQKGKRYLPPTGLKPQKPINTASLISDLNDDDVKEKKRLYREAMLHIHPDKFSMNNDKVELATELTTRLIEIYKSENLEALKTYHAHLFANEMINFDRTTVAKIEINASPDAYLIKEKERLVQTIDELRNRHTYHVLSTYKDPHSFVHELRAYYQDRIFKLRKRTRTKI